MTDALEVVVKVVVAVADFSVVATFEVLVANDVVLVIAMQFVPDAL